MLTTTPEMLSENIIEINGLTKEFKHHTALDNITTCIKKGSIVGLLGPNGSGKTTLIKVLTGLLTHYHGEVKIDGATPGYEANNFISYLPDKEHLPAWLSVNAAINFFRDFYEDFDTHKARDMITSLNIPLTKKLKHLSRGQREKVQLALVMSRNARLYILDEPIGAVDPASRDLIVETILKNINEGSSVLISTHIISDIEPILDYALFIRDGKIFMQDDVESIRENHAKSLDELFREVYKNVI